ncbi:hypothetical protein SUGI_0200070 [Cryptomeria japonica]|nr:hypothetical protein SUGI_0200070 [Cryptomeria japonica]
MDIQALKSNFQSEVDAELFDRHASGVEIMKKSGNTSTSLDVCISHIANYIQELVDVQENSSIWKVRRNSVIVPKNQTMVQAIRAFRSFNKAQSSSRQGKETDIPDSTSESGKDGSNASNVGREIP